MPNLNELDKVADEFKEKTLKISSLSEKIEILNSDMYKIIKKYEALSTLKKDINSLSDGLKKKVDILTKSLVEENKKNNQNLLELNNKVKNSINSNFKEMVRDIKNINDNLENKLSNLYTLLGEKFSTINNIIEKQNKSISDNIDDKFDLINRLNSKRFKVILGINIFFGFLLIILLYFIVKPIYF